MDIKNFSKKLDDHLKTDVRDIFDRRIFPGDVVYYNDGDSKTLKIGIVSKLTNTGCKILDNNKVYVSKEMCIVSGNEDMAASRKEKLEKQLEKSNQKEKEVKSIKKKSIIYIEKNKENRVFLGQKTFEFKTSEEMKSQMKDFMNSESRILVLCKDPYEKTMFFSDSIFSKNLYFQPIIHKMFYNDIKLEYISSAIKDQWKEKIKSEIEYAKNYVEKDMYNWEKYPIEVISDKSFLKKSDKIYQIFFDEDFLFIEKRRDSDEKAIAGSSYTCINFYYYWLYILRKYFDREKGEADFYFYRFMSNGKEALKKFFFDTDEWDSSLNSKIYNTYLFLKKELQNI